VATSLGDQGVVFHIASFEHSFSLCSLPSYISLLYFIFLCIYHIDFSESHISNNAVHHDRTKHIAIQHHFIREQVELGSVEILHIPSGKNIADVVTNPIPRELFERLETSTWSHSGIKASGNVGIMPLLPLSLL